jgi:CBS domain-containing protein
MRIVDVLNAKSQRDVITIAPGATVRELVALLAEHNVGALVVSTDGRSLAGIVSERDVVRRLDGASGDATLDLTVADIMTSEVETCDGEAPLDLLMQVMTAQRIRHVPVVEAGQVTGIISIGDVVKHKIGELEFERDQLDSYLHQT